MCLIDPKLGNVAIAALNTVHKKDAHTGTFIYKYMYSIFVYIYTYVSIFLSISLPGNANLMV